jgi:hypothetical protein
MERVTSLAGTAELWSQAKAQARLVACPPTVAPSRCFQFAGTNPVIREREWAPHWDRLVTGWARAHGPRHIARKPFLPSEVHESGKSSIQRRP